MSGIRKIGKNAVMVLVARGFDVISSVIIIAILTRSLGVEVYGKYSLVMALVFALTSLAHMGLPKILVRDISQDRSSAGKHLGVGLIFVTFMCAVVVLLSIPAIYLFKLDSTLVIVLGVAVGAEMMRIFAGVFISVVIAHERMEYDMLITLSYRLIFFILLVIVVALKLHFVFIFLAMLASYTVFLVISALVCYKKFSARPVFRNWSGNLKYLSLEILPVGASFVVLQAYQYVDIFVLKFMRGFEEVALFQAPYAIILKCQLFPRILVVAFAPLLARLAFADPSYAKLAFIYSKILKYIFIAAIPLTILGVIYAEEFVSLFFGKDFVRASVPFKILVFGLPVILIDFFSDATLISIGKQQLGFLSATIALVINLILDLILINKYGYMGASFAALISFVCLFALNLFFVTRFVKDVSMFNTLVLPLSAGLFVGVLLIKFDYVNLLLSLPAGMLVYLIILFMAGAFSHKEFFNISKAIEQAKNAAD